MATIQEMLTDSLRDIYDAERQAAKSLPKMIKTATSMELKQAFTEHLEVTKGQIARLEQVFEILGARAKAKPCRAMQGLVEETLQHVSEHQKGHELDAILIASGQKIEHYEISAYGTARAMAKAAGQKEAANLLQETLKEEELTDKLLTKVAISVYREMVREEGESEAGVDEEAAIANSAGRNTPAKKKVAAKGTSVAAAKEAPVRGKKAGASKQTGSGDSKTSGSKAGSSVTTNHDEIRTWAEDRGAHPACVSGTGDKGDSGLLRLDFPGYSGADSLEEISWEDFFQKFDEQGLALLYQETTAKGEKSNFNKIIAKETADMASEGKKRSARK
ncbi:MAG: ferritin-like domain-containing protein [Bryobacteraceae bacterium]|nr:ferritin-like domain-containing protein [Bryobacteraceae bacterium]